MNKGEIWFIDLSGRKGHEQSGKRPSIVVGRANGLTTVIPLTANLNRANLPFTHTVIPSSINGLHDVSIALVFQISTCDDSFFINKIGKISKEDEHAVDELIMDFLKLG